MKKSKTRIAGWIISGLIFAMLCFGSASGKFTEWEGKAEMFGHLGWESDVMFKIGIVEVAIAVLFLIPRTAFVGAILLSAYLGGATASHVRVGEPFFVPVMLGVIAWVALGLRDPRIFHIAFGTPPATTDANSDSTNA
ncbi:MAG: DoxX family protein [Rhodopirellula sp. JB044]|uniref:DoxX family protein n=1 Tax=Rhodopirellula sp. JB044 TaxID=3342844 RepID=UPI00370AA575